MFASNTSQVSSDATYIEDVFSTYLYTGNGASNPINNGIDLAGKGGLVWFKNRTMSNNSGSVWNKGNHLLMDTARGVSSGLSSNLTNAAQTEANHLTSFNSNGFTLGANWSPNNSGEPWASWTFRKQPKFFDVVTYTGDGSTSKSIAHSLGSAPGCMIIKDTNLGDNWYVYHRSTGYANSTFLNLTNAASAAGVQFGGADPTSTAFTVGYSSGDAGPNFNGKTYVAYLFAHNAGGFGLTGTDNVISCGSFTGAGYPGPATINLGYEPQWVLIKRTDNTSNWVIFDNMRGWPANNNSTSGAQSLKPNLSAAEGDTAYGGITSTGFQWFGSGDVNEPNVNGGTYIYVAIRRGPMKTPTSRTSVFAPTAATGSTGTSRTIGFPADMIIERNRDANDNIVTDRLRGFGDSTAQPALLTTATSAENTTTYSTAYNVWNTTRLDGSWANGVSSVWWQFRRAPGFFDEVCYTGTGSAQTINHNLGVVPELMIVKDRTSTTNWPVYASPLGNTGYFNLNGNFPSFTGATIWNSTTPTSTVFSVDGSSVVNASGDNYVAYLFASCPGVSKVGTYTGNGSTQTINCGFTGGARFVWLQRTSNSTNTQRYVFDTARGMTTSTDPWLSLNSTAAESATTGACTTTAVGFSVDASKVSGVNANGETYVYLAIA